jgi:hypothetical protein
VLKGLHARLVDADQDQVGGVFYAYAKRPLAMEYPEPASGSGVRPVCLGTLRSLT